MVVLKKIGVLSLAKIYAVIGAVVGFIANLLLALFVILLNSVPIVQSGGVSIISGVEFAVMLITLPILYAILGFIGGALMAILYNFIAKFVGGVELELQ